MEKISRRIDRWIRVEVLDFIVESDIVHRFLLFPVHDHFHSGFVFMDFMRDDSNSKLAKINGPLAFGSSLTMGSSM